ncbi:MAG: tetratricopeptide repeat protein [Promethearchaeota archaeon]
MTEQTIPRIYEPFELDLKTLMSDDEPLTFLVGAGISMEPPSGLMSAWQLMKAILSYGAPEETVDKLLAIKDLRYEYLIQQFRDIYDRQLKLLDYFELSSEPNLIHQFLAQQVREGQFVMTTNFDPLIEHALGLDEEKLNVIITREDFEHLGNPQKNKDDGLLAVYKIHGSLKNAKTGENTRDSVITTLDSLGKHKEGEVFGVESFKRDFFAKVCQERTLLVMGYSGGDDFDIVPTLRQMDGLKRVIWISHSNVTNQEVEVQRVRSKQLLSPKEIALLKREDELLYTLGLLEKVEVIKVNTHTASLISNLSGVPYAKSEAFPKQDMNKFIADHFSSPSEGNKEFFAAQIFDNYGFVDEALDYFQRAYELHKQSEDPFMAMDLHYLGSIYKDKGEFRKALDYHLQAYEVHKKLGLIQGAATTLSSIGLIYRHMGKSEQALEYHQKAYEIYKDVNSQEGMGSELSNIALVYHKIGQPQKALEYHQQANELFESIGSLGNMANALGNMGVIYKEMGRPHVALEQHQKAFEIYKKLGGTDGMARQLSNMGRIYRGLGRPRVALEQHQKAFEMYKQLGNQEKIADQLNHMGIIFMNAGQLQQAFQHLQVAYTLHKEVGNKETMAYDLNMLGLVYRGVKQPEKALECFQEACEVFEQVGSQYYLAETLTNMGVVYMENGKDQLALEYYQKAYEIDKKLNNLSGIAANLGNIGLIHMNTKELPQALDNLQQSLEAYTRLGDRAGVARQVANIGLVYLSLEEFHKALDHFQRAYEIFRQLGYRNQMQTSLYQIEQTKILIKEREQGA